MRFSCHSHLLGKLDLSLALPVVLLVASASRSDCRRARNCATLRPIAAPPALLFVASGALLRSAGVVRPAVVLHALGFCGDSQAFERGRKLLEVLLLLLSQRNFFRPDARVAYSGLSPKAVVEVVNIRGSHMRHSHGQPEVSARPLVCCDASPSMPPLRVGQRSRTRRP
uniref:Secreted protein n=1 Tax=Peronospora matthiolae TaxID=2874970 RepID=A0AAV1VL69_9STRA